MSDKNCFIFGWKDFLITHCTWLASLKGKSFQFVDGDIIENVTCWKCHLYWLVILLEETWQTVMDSMHCFQCFHFRNRLNRCNCWSWAGVLQTAPFYWSDKNISSWNFCNLVCSLKKSHISVSEGLPITNAKVMKKVIHRTLIHEVFWERPLQKHGKNETLNDRLEYPRDTNWTLSNYFLLLCITCQGLVPVILVPSQRANLECNFRSGGSLPSIHTLEACAHPTIRHNGPRRCLRRTCDVPTPRFT